MIHYPELFNQSRNVFFIFINTTVRVKNLKYVLECYLTILPLEGRPLMSVCFLIFKLREYAPPRPVSMEHVALLELLHVFCKMYIQQNMAEP